MIVPPVWVSRCRIVSRFPWWPFGDVLSNPGESDRFHSANSVSARAAFGVEREELGEHLDRDIAIELRVARVPRRVRGAILIATPSAVFPPRSRASSALPESDPRRQRLSGFSP